MSTYTDLHNKVKETINVDYCSRDSFQEVHLKNPRNEYYGTFKGTFEAEGINVNGGLLSDVTLVDVTLSNVTYPGGPDFDKLGKQVLQISADQLQCNENISQTITDLGTEESNRKAVDKQLSDAIDSFEDTIDEKIGASFNIVNSSIEAVSVDLAEDISETIDAISAVSSSLCIEISTETNLRIEEDQKLINAISSISSFLSTEINTSVDNIINEIDLSVKNLNDRLNVEETNRITADNHLKDYIDSETIRAIEAEKDLSVLTLSVDNNSIARYNQMQANLDEHNSSNISQFAEAHNEMTSTVERERHYEIVNGSIEQNYPYILTDFAVNTINAKIIDKFVWYKDEIIGQVDTVDEKMQVSFYDLTKHEELLVAVDSYGKYLFDGNNIISTKNGYKLSYNATTDSLMLQNNPDPFYGIHDSRNGNLLGKIYSPLFNTSKQILSGRLTIDTSDSTLLEFNKIEDQPFSVEETKIVSDSNEVIFNFEEQTFTFRKGVATSYYCPLSTENGQLVGQIFEGNVKYNGSQISSINVVLDKTYAELLESNQFSAEYLPNTILSCNIANKIFTKYDVHAIYKYGLYLTSDIDYSNTIYGYVVLTSENGNVLDKNYDQISVIYDFKSDSGNVELNGEYLLTKSTDTNLDLWIYESPVAPNGDKMTVMFNGQCVMFNGIIAGGIVDSKYTVRTNAPEVYNAETYLSTVWTTTSVDLTQFNEFVSSEQLKLTATIDEKTTEPIKGEYLFEVKDSTYSAIDVVIPARTSENISRELMIVCSFESETTHKDISFSYVSDDCSCSRLAKINDTEASLFNIPMNKEVVLKVKEIAVGRFEVVDLRENHQYDLINELRDDLTTLDTKVNDLSVALSNEIDNLSAALSNEIDDLSVKFDARISTNKENIDILFNRLKGGVWYKGRTHIDDNITTFAAAISSVYMKNDTTIDEVLNTKLSAGWYYVVEAEDIEKHYIIEGKDVENKDWILITEDTILSNITSSIIDVVDMMDADVVTKTLANQLSTNLEKQISDLCVELSNVLSTYTDTSVEALSDALSSEIDDLCVELSNVLSTYTDTSVEALSDALSSEIDDLCVELSNVLSTYTNTSIKELSSEITADINYLSSELSDYHNTLSGIDRENHKADVGHIIETDNLMITDVTEISENGSHPKYYMTMLSGTIVLKQI